MRGGKCISTRELENILKYERDILGKTLIFFLITAENKSVICLLFLSVFSEFSFITLQHFILIYVNGGVSCIL